LSELNNIQIFINDKTKHVTMINKEINKWRHEYSLIHQELTEEIHILNNQIKEDQIAPLSDLEG